MPTCKYKPVASIPLRSGKKTLQIFKLFPISHWDEAAPEGVFRVMSGERWVDGSYTVAGLANLLAEALAEAGVSPAMPDGHPLQDMPKGTRVRVPNGRRCMDDEVAYDQTFTAAPAIRCFDGSYRVPVTLYGQGTVYVDLDSVQLVRKPLRIAGASLGSGSAGGPGREQSTARGAAL